jgi:DNA helicase-2/ATP-dependent DNA helicase PcrA
VAARSPNADLATFLEEVALISEVDNLAEEGSVPTLMTLHAAKGLEFPVVFIIGLDEGTLPHQRSFDDAEAMAEERRLMYVGLTRAMDRIYLVRAFRRTSFGESDLSLPSRFLEDIPEYLLSGHVVRERGGRGPRSRGASIGPPARLTTWNNPPRPAQAAPLVLRYRSGQRVLHATFGEGIVIESRALGDDEIVSVAFEAHGLKRLAASLAAMEVLP